MWTSILLAAGKVGIDPALIYAMKKTGRMVAEENQRYLTDEELKEWQRAIEEYKNRTGSRATQ